MSQKHVITGGAGFIGSNLADRLLEDGHRVVIVDDLSGGKKENVPKDVEFHNADIRDTDVLTDVFASADRVFHLAALPRVQYSIEHPDVTHEVNVTGTLNVLEAARKTGVRRVVYAASSSVYGDQEDLPLHEDLPAVPKSPYALQKYQGEGLMRLWAELYELPTVSLRFFNVYGPRMDPEGAYALVVGKFLKMHQGGKPLTITGDGEQTRDFTHVRDMVDAIVRSSESEKVGVGNVINIGSGKNVSVNELAELIGGETEHIEPRLEPRHTKADIDKAKELLGWEPTIVLEEGIQKLKAEFNITE